MQKIEFTRYVLTNSVLIDLLSFSLCLYEAKLPY